MTKIVRDSKSWDEYEYSYGLSVVISIFITFTLVTNMAGHYYEGKAYAFYIPAILIAATLILVFVGHFSFYSQTRGDFISIFKLGQTTLVQTKFASLNDNLHGKEFRLVSYDSKYVGVSYYGKV